MTTSAGAGIRVLLYCDADLNLIDGSSIWTTSIAQVLAGAPRVQVELVLKRPVTRPLLTEPLGDLSGIALVDPFSDPRTAHVQGAWRLRGRLEPAEAAQVLAALDAQRPFELVLVRGLQLCRAVVEQPCFGGRVWAYLTDFTDEDAADVRAVCQGSARLLCQTPQIRDYLRRIAGIGEDRLLLLPPMIPDMPEEPPAFGRISSRLVYVGKLAPLWMTEEMVVLMPSVRQRHPDAELHVAGDKFHNYPPSPDFSQRLGGLLEATAGVVWHRGMRREEALQLIRSCAVGCSWRHSALDGSLELSTKVLEYGAQGKAVLLNRVPMHEDLLGTDYPLFCNAREEYLAAVDRALSDDRAYARAARRAWEASRRFTFSAARQRLAPYLLASEAASATAPTTTTLGTRPSAARPLRVVFAGHDLKFASHIMTDLDTLSELEVRADEWAGHNTHDPERSRRLAEWADVVVAEWCLGNAVWYSHNLPPDTALIVRVHRVELETTYPDELDMSNVHRIVAVSPYFASLVRARLPAAADRVVYIPNTVDCRLLDRPKLDGSEFRIGMLGWTPIRKRPDLALDLLAMLQHRDSRYRLYFKGRFPTELAWLWRRDEERDYYRRLMAHLNRSPWRDSVVFDPFGRDLDVWWRKIGFVLSTSDMESFHVSVAEGMASGAIPIVRRRPEVADLWPEEYIFDEPREAAEMIEQFCREGQEMATRAQKLKRYARQRFDRCRVAAMWKDAVFAVAAERRRAVPVAHLGC